MGPSRTTSGTDHRTRDGREGPRGETKTDWTAWSKCRNWVGVIDAAAGSTEISVGGVEGAAGREIGSLENRRRVSVESSVDAWIAAARVNPIHVRPYSTRPVHQRPVSPADAHGCAVQPKTPFPTRIITREQRTRSSQRRSLAQGLLCASLGHAKSCFPSLLS